MPSCGRLSCAERAYCIAAACAYWGCKVKFAGIVAEIELFFVNKAVGDGRYDTVRAALGAFNADKGLNKLEMQRWLQEIGIDAATLSINSFVNLPLELAKSVWNLVLHERFHDIACNYPSLSPA